MTRALKAFVVAYLAAVLVIGGATAGSAHVVGDYITRYRAAETTQYWHFTAGVPTGAWRERIRDGVRTWNNLQESLTFFESGQVANFLPPGEGGSCPVAGRNTIHYRNIDDRDGTFAYVSPCVYNNDGRISSVTMVIDNSEDWYTGTGDAPDGFQVLGACVNGPCKVDAWSIVTHEWGHIFGFMRGPDGDGHFPRRFEICQADSADQTMCAQYGKGHERARTLETHDIHTFKNAY
jgi:hypothetical protein